MNSKLPEHSNKNLFKIFNPTTNKRFEELPEGSRWHVKQAIERMGQVELACLLEAIVMGNYDHMSVETLRSEGIIAMGISD